MIHPLKNEYCLHRGKYLLSIAVSRLFFVNLRKQRERNETKTEIPHHLNRTFARFVRDLYSNYPRSEPAGVITGPQSGEPKKSAERCLAARRAVFWGPKGLIPKGLKWPFLFFTEAKPTSLAAAPAISKVSTEVVLPTRTLADRPRRVF